MGGGSEGDKSYDPVFGTRFFINADYNAQGQMGEGTASTTSLTNAIEITEVISLKGLQSKFDCSDEVIASDRIDPTRTMALMNITIDTESSAGTDDLIFISSNGFTSCDWIILTGKNSGRITTIKEDADGNIELLDNSSFDTGDETRSLVLRYDQVKNNWYELFRTDIPVINNAYLRTKGIILPKSGTLVKVLVTGGTKTLTPGTDAGYVTYTGNFTPASAISIEHAGSPVDGDQFVIDYRATLTTVS